MAATAEAARLTEAHRLAQAGIGAQVVRQMLAAWPLLDPQDLDATFRRWLTVVSPIVQTQRRASATLASAYLSAFRTLELGVDAGPFAPVPAGPAPARAVATSMLITGPATIRSARAGGVASAIAVNRAQGRAAAAAMRHALNGGRETVVSSLERDRLSLGWSRVTSAKPCAFCAMLASRGPVYRSEGTADFHAHDHCSCAAEPVYRRDAAWAPGARRLRELWDSSTGDARGPEKLAVFRQAIDGQR